MITVVGLGPGSLSRVPASTQSILTDNQRPLVLRTLQHPAAAELGELREVITCDDLYEAHQQFDDVYEAIVDRVLSMGPETVYAVPGSPLVGEFAVKRLLEMEHQVEVVPGESFVDAVLARVGYDPFDRGLQILNGHALPDPLVLDKPTIVGHLDRAEVLADVIDAIGRVTAEGQEITVLARVGAEDERVTTAEAQDIDLSTAGLRTSIYLDPIPSGLVGAVNVMRRLRDECPWDRSQNHETLVKNLIEETYELVDAISALGPDEDWVGYALVEDELGDVLLQVLFHSAIARERGVFDIDGVAGALVEKLVRRHPHVFGDVTAETPDEVKRNWDRIKAEESGAPRESEMDGIPVTMPALQRSSKVQNRAAKVGFDWEEVNQVLPKIAEELDELEAAVAGEGDVQSEVGDLLFSVVNASRHLGVDAEVALRQATSRFEARFRTMAAEGPLDGLTLEQLDERWERAKSAESG